MHLLTEWTTGLPVYLMCLVPGLVVMTEPALVAGVLLPSVGSMMLLGFLAHSGAVSLAVAVPTGILAALTGDSLAFLVGRRWARPRWAGRRDSVRRAVGERRWDRAEWLTLRYGGLAVVAARYLTGLRTLVPRLAALSGMRYRRFLAHSVPAGVTWGTTFVLAGYLAGASYLKVADAVGVAGLLVLGAVAVAIAGAVTIWRFRARRVARNATALLAAPVAPGGTTGPTGDAAARR